MRAAAGGRALLLLLPSEREGMLAALEAARVPIRQIRLNPGKAQPVTPALQALLSKNTELKVLATRGRMLAHSLAPGLCKACLLMWRHIVTSGAQPRP